MNPQESYEVGLTPLQSIETITRLLSAMLSNPRVDPTNPADTALALRHAESLFNEICHDVELCVNLRPDLFKLPCDP